MSMRPREEGKEAALARGNEAQNHQNNGRRAWGLKMLQLEKLGMKLLKKMETLHCFGLSRIGRQDARKIGN